ncbi:uncharacterized protein LOC135134383 isoform X2 [Zophobas morio]|uniref:uncharacterized protein LOC135134383 isoform X2 n=1 Tax=Zophobas morio TaxID=2755281 RepID=UPI003083C7E2
MYAVVEFEDRKCAVVPLNWLLEDQQMCYWPRAATPQQFDKMISTCKEPLRSWPKYKVINVTDIKADYDDANALLQKMIEESSSSSDSGNAQQPLHVLEVNVITNDVKEKDETQNASKKRRHEKDMSSCDESSASEFSDDEQSSCSKISNSTSRASTVTLGNSEKLNEDGSSGVSVVASSSSAGLPTSSIVKYLLEKILRKVERLDTIQEQNTLLLNNILSSIQSSNMTQLNRPVDLPNIPVSCKAEYKALEEFLKIEEKFNYMKCRLACIGGTSVRNCVMNMMKFILTDKVAVKFNWIARDNKKKAFKDTLMSKVIQEAVMTAYSKHADRTDLTDRNIQDAMKDWLKLAKHRLDHKAKKLRGN